MIETRVLRTYRCPDDDRGPQEAAYPAGIPDIIGCGREFTAELDDEGLADCPHCGMFFGPRPQDVVTP